MIPITDKVSNAIVKYERYFGYRISIGDISTNWKTPEEFVASIRYAIEDNDPIYGGEKKTEHTEK